MDIKKEELYSIREIIGRFKFFLFTLRKRIWLLLIVISTGGALGAFFFFKQKPRYNAICTFILEEKSGSGGGLAGLASQFGINIGGVSGGGGIFAGDNILSILKSKKVVQKVLLTKVDSTVNGISLADLYLEFTNTKKGWQKNPRLADINFSNSQTIPTPLQDSVLDEIYEVITKKQLLTERSSKQGSIIKVQVTASDCLFARLMTERLVSEASRMYMDIKIGTAQANIEMLQKRSDSLLFLLNKKTFSAAASQPIDINPGIKTAMVPVEISTRDKSVLATLYAEVTKNMEMSKLLLSQQSPVIQILDTPGILLHDNKSSLTVMLVVYMFGLGMIYFVIELGVFILKGNSDSI